MSFPATAAGKHYLANSAYTSYDSEDIAFEAEGIHLAVHEGKTVNVRLILDIFYKGVYAKRH